MKATKLLAAVVVLGIMLTACSTPQSGGNSPSVSLEKDATAVEIVLSDNEIKVDGVPVGTNAEERVYIGNDIVYYEAGKDFTYGEGGQEDAHDAQTAAEHTVVHITQPGTYSLRGSLSKGQIAVDLGEDAEKDPDAVVTLILNGADITCEVAPAVIFYNVYECGTAEADTATKDVDTSAAGANVILADGTVNTINGSYVARIYKPDSVVLSDDGTEVEDAKKLHKYDGAFYSRMSMNVYGEAENSGILNINAKNEGLDSELHLTINGGVININSGNDGINTNEDGVSVTTVNDGVLNIRVTGETGEGDGIDSNGWLVINGGTVIAQACSFSADAGIDSDMGIHINGGTVIATGSMLDRIEDGGQNYVVFGFASRQSGAKTIRLNNEEGVGVLEFTPDNDYSILAYSSPDLIAGNYTLWSDGTQLAGARSGTMGVGMGRPGERPDGEIPQGWPEGMEPMQGGWPTEGPQGMAPPAGERPFEGQKPPQQPQRPAGNNEGGKPEGQWKPNDRGEAFQQERTAEFEVLDGGTMFRGISEAE